MALRPINRAHGSAKIIGQLLRARERAVYQSDLFGAALRQRPDHSACAPACAHHDDGAGIEREAGLGLRYVLDEAVAIVIGAVQRAVSAHGDAGNGADTPRGLVDLVDDCKRLLLVRNRQVAA